MTVFFVSPCIFPHFFSGSQLELTANLYREEVSPLYVYFYFEIFQFRFWPLSSYNFESCCSKLFILKQHVQTQFFSEKVSSER